MIEIVFLVLLLIYSLLILRLMIGWQRMTSYWPQGPGIRSVISVVVPARNEEGKVGLLIQDLKQQSDKNFEVFIIDDHSSDLTFHEASEAIQGDDRFTMLRLTEQFGKKRALAKGIRQASGKIIITVDSDCRVNENWITSVRKCFEDDRIKLVFGPVRLTVTDGWGEKMQAMEFLSLIGTGVGTMGLGFPTMCNGANLAFQKEAYSKVGGYDGNFNIASGDDEFMLRKIHQAYPESIRFNTMVGGRVDTVPQKSFRDFIHQRIRWAGKWGRHQDGTSAMLAVFVFTFHLSFVAITIREVYLGSLYWLVIFWGIKFFTEGLFLLRINTMIKIKWDWTAFFLLQVLYSLYAVIFGVLANCKKPVWKERVIERNDLVSRSTFMENNKTTHV